MPATRSAPTPNLPALNLAGGKGLVIGIANEQSIPYGCAQAFRALDAELRPKGIRVHAISSDPLKTRAASGIDHFDGLLARAAECAPMHHLVGVEDVGTTTRAVRAMAKRRASSSNQYAVTVIAPLSTLARSHPGAR
jgi:enoyl-[acyl-carrier-protein] reductase (NADH)